MDYCGPFQLNHVNVFIISTVFFLSTVPGATATGKSSAAEYLCNHHSHHKYEIIVADSVQAMRHLNIGANKPSEEVMRDIPHHMVNIHDPGVLYSAGQYCVEAKDVISAILQRGNIPLVVGGNTMVSSTCINILSKLCIVHNFSLLLLLCMHTLGSSS
jgi:tRNA A37 N6-isopentenylltransferase MiaA